MVYTLDLGNTLTSQLCDLGYEWTGQVVQEWEAWYYTYADSYGNTVVVVVRF